jgi:HSP20 family molecular chaperone IbpA
MTMFTTLNFIIWRTLLRRAGGVMKDNHKFGLAVGLCVLLGFGTGYLSKGIVDKENPDLTAFGPVGKALFAPLIPLAVLPKLVNFPADLPLVKTTQTDKEIIVNAQIPGLKDGEVDLIVGQDLLTITGHKVHRQKDKKSIQTVSEAFEESIKLPCLVDTNHTKSTIRNGVVTVQMSKASNAIAAAPNKFVR